MQTRTIAILGACIAVVAAVLTVAWYYAASPGQPIEQGRPLSIGFKPFEPAALIFIAEDRGYFSKNGLNVTIREYESGAAAMTGLDAGEIGIALSAEYPVVTAAFGKKNISILASIDQYQSGYIVGRKDRGIRNVSDLRGKRIGVTKGTIGEFYFGRFLELNGIATQDVTLVDTPLSPPVETIAGGNVDAIVILHADLGRFRKRLGDNMTAWKEESKRMTYTVLVSDNDWIAGHRDDVARLLLSLDMADAYLTTHPAEAKETIQKRLNCTDAYIAEVWPDHRFGLTLDQTLILAMEDEARWTIATNLTEKRRIPNFLDYIDATGMDTVRPDSVDIIGRA